jgi:hypothetical protein
MADEYQFNKELMEMAKSHFNEPMISSFDIVRCVGYAEDDSDCYIIARRSRSLASQIKDGELVWLTCVGGYTFLDRLKGQQVIISNDGEHWDDFVRLDHVLALNGAPKEENFILIYEP